MLNINVVSIFHVMKISAVFLIFINPVFSIFVMNLCAFVNGIYNTLNIAHCFGRNNFEDGSRSIYHSMRVMNNNNRRYVNLIFTICQPIHTDVSVLMRIWWTNFKTASWLICLLTLLLYFVYCQNTYLAN